MWFSCEPDFCAHTYDVGVSRIISSFAIASYRFHRVDTFTLEENVAQWLLMLQKIALCRLEWALGVCFRGNSLNVERTVALCLHKVSKRRLKYKIGARNKTTEWQRLEKNRGRKKRSWRKYILFLSSWKGESKWNCPDKVTYLQDLYYTEQTAALLCSIYKYSSQ